VRISLLAVAIIVAPSLAVAANGPAIEKVSAADLQRKLLASGQPRSDAGWAQELSRFELTDRISSLRLAQWSASLPGEQSREALLLLADKSAFLNPPVDEIPAVPVPDAARTREMLVKLVNYVNTTLRQLPNLIASRETTGFEDRPAEDVLESTGTVSYSYLPLHVVGRSTASVTFRDRKEVVEPGKSSSHGQRIGGLASSGEFGPILATVLSDAVTGRITWARWEQGAKLTLAVFHFQVPDGKSHYHVAFCCELSGYDSSGQPQVNPFDERAPYHGEIAFDPADGTIHRMTLQTELPAHELVASAGITVEYAPTEIAGKSYMCPTRSVSILEAYVYHPRGMFSRADYRGPTKTFLNDVVFGHYRRFGSEARILTGENSAPQF
jgi:hypothetical protein